MNRRNVVLSASLIAGLAAAGSAQAQVQVQWWHAMSGPLGEWVADLAKDFNAKQKEYVVVPTFKGTYGETLTAGIAAFRAGTAPDILQVYEVGTATMMASKGAIKPVSEVMTMGGAKFDPKVYIPAVAGYYTAPNGQMLSLPFNSSTTVFYYNKDAFKAAAGSERTATVDEGRTNYVAPLGLALQQITKDVEVDLRGKHVIVCEDIYDSGRTLAAIRDLLRVHHPASVEVAAFLYKKVKKRVAEVEIKYKGYDIEDKFVVGYGLDYSEMYRNLPYVGVLKRSVYEGGK